MSFRHNFSLRSWFGSGSSNNKKEVSVVRLIPLLRSEGLSGDGSFSVFLLTIHVIGCGPFITRPCFILFSI